jgi:hypothetical protein
MAILVPADGEARDLLPGSGETFTLAELQKAVGGDIQVLRLRDGRWMVMNEYGKHQSLPLNIAATHVMAGIIAADDFIVGDVVICTSLEAGAD